MLAENAPDAAAPGLRQQHYTSGDSGQFCERIYMIDLVHRRSYKFALCLPWKQRSKHFNVPLQFSSRATGMEGPLGVCSS